MALIQLHELLDLPGPAPTSLVPPVSLCQAAFAAGRHNDNEPSAA
jgi:hypothetical protein